LGQSGKEHKVTKLHFSDYWNRYNSVYVQK